MKHHKIYVFVVALVLLWGCLHIPGIIYGTSQLPLHQSYVGDEQSPVNGAFHILESKSLFGLRNVWTVYYGPVFSVLALPAVIADAGIKYLKGDIHSAQDYKQSVLFDWGNIVIFCRIISVLFAIGFLCALYYFFKSSIKKSFSKEALLMVSLLAVNYYFFEYSNFFKHWIFAMSALGMQWLSLKYILEDKGKKWWIIHVIVTLFAAGVSYVSLSHLIIWIPVIVSWIRRKEWTKFIPLIRMFYTVIMGMLLIIWWHPVILFRYFSMVGIGNENVGNSLNLQNPLLVSGGSLLYYCTLVILNCLPLIIAGILLVIALWKEKIYARLEVWIIALPGIFYFILFAPAPHHEGRYMLPTIVSLVVLVGYLYIEYRKLQRSQIYTRWVVGLLILYALFHAIHIAGWIGVYSQGPGEQAMIHHVLSVAKEGKTHALIVQGYIAGHVHTLEAYKNYALSHDKGNLSLYKEILSTPSPTGVDLLDATYVPFDQYEKDPSIAKDFDQVVIMNVPRKDLGELNQFDFIDESIMRIWHARDLLPSYTYLK